MDGVLFCGVARISSPSSSDENTPPSTPDADPDSDGVADAADAAAALASIPNSSSRFCKTLSCFRFSKRSDCWACLRGWVFMFEFERDRSSWRRSVRPYSMF